MIIQQSKKYLKIFSFILLAIIAISFCATKVRAEIFNGTGGIYTGCIGKKCACNQSSSHLSLQSGALGGCLMQLVYLAV